MKNLNKRIEALKGMYQFISPYHDDKRKLPFEVIGNSYNKDFPIKVETVEYRGFEEKKVTDDYKIEVVEDFIKSGFLTKVKATNLNPFFIDQIINFAHLVTPQEQTKKEFLESIKKTYSLENPKTQLFYISAQKSVFNTIKLNNQRTQILFNQ